MLSKCVVLVPSGRVYDSGCEAALAELSARGLPVWRFRGDPPADARDRMAADALAAGFDEFLFVDPDVVFDPADADRLRSHGLPLVAGLLPLPGRRAFACEFLPGTPAVRFGRHGGPVEVRSCGLGFALVRRAVFEAVAGRLRPAPGPCPRPPVPYFSPAAGDPVPAAAELGEWSCGRARARGFRPVADTAVRLWRVAPYRYGWEDAGRDPERFADYTFHLAAAPAPPPGPRLRGEARPLPPGFPRVRAYVASYPANAERLALTLASVRASDWGTTRPRSSSRPTGPPGTHPPRTTTSGRSKPPPRTGAISP